MKDNQKKMLQQLNYKNKISAYLIELLIWLVIQVKPFKRNDLYTQYHFYIISQMLSFTNNQKNNHQNINQLDYQPLVISNKGSNPQVFPRNPQKKISKTITNSNQILSGQNIGKKSSRKSYQHYSPPLIEQQYWKQSGKIGIFDGKLRKNELAQQQRRIKAQQKRSKKEEFNNIVSNQVEIRSKALNLEKQQQKQIQKLKRLIQKQREQKQKNDKVYEQKLKLIEKQRAELVKLQRKIQQNGVKNQKQFKKQINVLLKNEIPSNDRGKCHQDQRITSKNQQLTQSQFNHQKAQLRQRQLEYLTDQREKALTKLHTVDYNPTIIPLLSRASYKIISTHISTLVELFIDDLLEQQVYLLQEIELKQKYQKQKQKQKQMLNDYYRQLNEFVDQAQQIQNRVGRYQTMRFEDLYIPKNHYKQEKKTINFKYYNQKHLKLQGINDDMIQQIQTRKERFVNYVSNFDQYKKNNLNMFEKVTQEMIDQAILKMAKELDNGSNDFVELIFRKQFQ